jgi:CO/xanthine dehydrogenase FAD-binding subunit
VKSFSYLAPRTIGDVVGILSAHGSEARLFAGGTDLLVRLRLGHVRPAIVVDVKRVEDIPADIKTSDDVVRVGARVVMTDLIADPHVRQHFPALVEAATVVGSVQIRNRATLAGNICNASPAADTAPALLAYGAVVMLHGPEGTRDVPLAEFFTGPGRTVIQRGEIVTAIRLPIPSAAAGSAFGRVTRRRGVDLATINLVTVVTATGEARFAYGAVGPRPFLVTDTTGVLGSAASDPKAREAALERLIAHASPISDVRGSREYRHAMLEVMSRRCWTTAIGRLADAVKKEEPS